MSDTEIKIPGQIDSEAIVISQASAGLEVVDKASADRASEIIVAGKKLIKAIKDYFDPMKKAADEAKRRILEAERQELSKIEPVVADLSAKVSRWLADEERRRREAEEARHQAELDRLILEAELVRQGKLKKLACYLAIVWLRVPRETRTYMVVIDPDEFSSEAEMTAEARRLVDDYLSEFDHETMSVEPFEPGSDYIGVVRC